MTTEKSRNVTLEIDTDVLAGEKLPATACESKVLSNSDKGVVEAQVLPDFDACRSCEVSQCPFNKKGESKI